MSRVDSLAQNHVSPRWKQRKSMITTVSAPFSLHPDKMLLTHYHALLQSWLILFGRLGKWRYLSMKLE